MKKIQVNGTEIAVSQINNEDFICITDMLKAKDGDFFISDWLRNRNTLEYIGHGREFIIQNLILMSLILLQIVQGLIALK